ncbi:MAG: mycofactocin biosynthesis glycosyltransferase MftF, partial [Mycobacteriaceae bacterium]
PELPVIVVDDGSGEGHRLQRVAELHGAHIIRHAESRGPAAARNTGLAQARTEFVAFLDSDVVPASGWLPPLLAHLSDPAVALVAPRITALDGARGWIARYERDHSSLDLGPREAPVVPHSRVAYVPSAALVLRRRAVTDCGFDESMPVAEDVDLCWRLHAQGWRLRYEPAATVAHQHRTTAGQWLRRKAFYGTGAAALAVRHPGKVSPLVLAPWTALACALLAGATPGGLIGAAAFTAASAVRISRTVAGLHHPLRLATLLAARGLGGACAQLAAAACRSYWPLSVALALTLPRARRVLVVVAVVEGLADWVQHRGPGSLDPLRYLAVKRLDDLAYGAGLWSGVVRGGSAAALRPSIIH